MNTKENLNKKKGELYYAERDIINPLSNKKLGTYKMFWYQKIGKDLYLIIIPKIFAKDPIDYKFCIIKEKKFRSLCKDCKLQKAV